MERIIREVGHPGNLIQGRIMTGTTKSVLKKKAPEF